MEADLIVEREIAELLSSFDDIDYNPDNESHDMVAQLRSKLQRQEDRAERFAVLAYFCSEFVRRTQHPRWYYVYSECLSFLQKMGLVAESGVTNYQYSYFWQMLQDGRRIIEADRCPDSRMSNNIMRIERIQVKMLLHLKLLVRAQNHVAF